MFLIRGLFFIIVLSLAVSVFGHEGETHDDDNDDGWETVANEVTEEQLKEINSIYVQEIKPVFQKKCLDCHSMGAKMPWYYMLPGAKQLMDRDIQEALEHMDMSNDFPFVGHGSPKDDLEAIARSIKENSMPPWQYKIIHWSSVLTKKEKEKINKWIKNGINILRKGERK